MSEHESKSRELEERTVQFSLSVIRACGPLASQTHFKPLVSQIIRSATSIGANYAEANNAASQADFKNKIYIAQKEAAETRYWLRLFEELCPDIDFSHLKEEAIGLNLILQKITTTMRTRYGK